jgi:hypothetical protein
LLLSAYFGQTGHSSETAVKEDIDLYHLEKSAVAEDSTEVDDFIQLQNTSILAKKLICLGWITGGKNIHQIPSQQCEQMGWLLPEKDVEASHSQPEKNVSSPFPRSKHTS